MQIQQHDNGKKGAFFIKENDTVLAEMTYVWSGDKVFIIDHTEVSDQLAGQGVGKKLVKAGVDFARAGGYKIIPLCPFAKKLLDKITEWQDVLHSK